MWKWASRFIYENSLSLVMFFLFGIFLAGQILSGYRVYNAERAQHDQPPVAYSQYLTSGHCTEAIFENWESEFLQMALFVLLAAFLKQKGSPESNELENSHNHSRLTSQGPNAPWPVKHGGLALKFYSHSLTIALALLFFLSFFLHALDGAKNYNEQQTQHGSAPLTLLQYARTPQFWFESFQNWQSEFLSLAVLIVLSIFLRERNSSQSKGVPEPHSKTGQ